MQGQTQFSEQLQESFAQALPALKKVSDGILAVCEAEIRAFMPVMPQVRETLEAFGREVARMKLSA
jgi:hypothetical protein